MWQVTHLHTKTNKIRQFLHWVRTLTPSIHGKNLRFLNTHISLPKANINILGPISRTDLSQASYHFVLDLSPK